MGYHRAGFEVVGVDLAPQPRYPFEFHQRDALAFVRKHGHEFDAIHASPPCQAHTALKTMWNATAHADLIPATRRALKRIGVPFVIENVPGAPLIDLVTLCGSMFGLETADHRFELRRHRLFESSFPPAELRCNHTRLTVYVYGHGGNEADARRFPKREACSFSDRREAMGIDWTTSDELAQAIPPAYTEYVGAALMAALTQAHVAIAAARLKAAA